MFYKKWFFLEEAVWNNAFSFEQRKNKKLYIPEIIDLSINDLDKIQIQDDFSKIAFEDFDFDDKLSTNYWLKNFYRIKHKWKEIILFDNHNHAFYFWYEARNKWIIWDDNLLIHIDEHADTRDNNKHLLKPKSYDLKKVFDFTNYVLNVGDYIIPAQEEWIIWEVIQIRNTKNLEDYIIKYYNKSNLEFNLFHSETQSIWLKSNWDSNNLHSINQISKSDFDNNKNKWIILNLDLDFFQPDLDFIDYDLKKKVVLNALEKADFVTVCTSPFFIDQKLAIKVFKDLFTK